MGGMIRIGVKYCGGCNPDYDRVRAVSDLAEELIDVMNNPNLLHVHFSGLPAARPSPP